MLRSPCELRICPNSEEVIVCEAGLAKIGVLNRLNASARSSKYLFSVTLELLVQGKVEAASCRDHARCRHRRSRRCRRWARNRREIPGTSRPDRSGADRWACRSTLARKLRAPVPEGSPLILMVSGKPVCARVECRPSASRRGRRPPRGSNERRTACFWPKGSSIHERPGKECLLSKYVGPHSLTRS